MKHYFTKTARYQNLLRLSGTILLFALGWGYSAHAQCSAPDFVAHTSTNSTCQSNGSITAGAATGGEGDTLQYALYNAANTTELRPWQLNTTFDNLASGSYTLRARYVCGVGFSPVYTKAVTVGGSYSPPIITGIDVQRRSQCNNGRINIGSTGGTNPKTYALVASLSATEPVAPADYIRQPQSSGIFDSLPAGTYYARVYDACGSYSTNSVTVSAFTQVNPFSIDLNITYVFCDSLSGRMYLSNLGDHVSGTADTLKRVWITFPDGSTDTLAAPASSGFTSRAVPLTLSKLGPVGPGNFPDNIGGSWPKLFRTGYKDGCGNTFTKDYYLEEFDLLILFNHDNSSSLNTCDSSAYRFLVSPLSSGPDTLLEWAGANINNNAFYSLDGGSTWEAVTTTGSYSQYIQMLIGSNYNVCFTYCGDTTCLTGTVAPLQALDVRTYESNRYACFGNSGFEFRAQAGTAPVAVEMLSGPSGQAWVNDSITSISSYTYLTSSRNMLPGDYIFRFTDACGQVGYDTVSVLYPFQVFDYSYSFPCGGTDMEIRFTNDSVRNFNSTSALSRSYLGLSGRLYKADSTLAVLATYDVDYTTGLITIPGSNISSLPNGNYFIRIWKTGADSCTIIDKAWEKTASLISLSNSLTVSPCSGTPATGTIIAIAQGASGGNSYSLYEGLVSDSTLVAGPQPSAIFNGLNESTTYIVTVSDSCGRGAQSSLSFNGAPLPVYDNAGGQMPCPGDSLTLFVNDIPEVNYQWYKNDTLLPGDTMSAYTIANVQTTDSGAYKVMLDIGSCDIFLASFRLAPSECGTPLSVSLLSFTAKAVGGNALLEWSTATERLSKGFNIERSTNGTDWNRIGYVASLSGNGNSSRQLDYVYRDNSPAPGVNYYRLQQLDIDGKSTYSDARRVFFGSGRQALLLYPNPTSSGLNIEGLEGGETIKVYNALGQHVQRQEAAGTKAYLDLNGLQAGMYQVQVTGPSGKSATYKLIKK